MLAMEPPKGKPRSLGIQMQWPPTLACEEQPPLQMRSEALERKEGDAAGTETASETLPAQRCAKGR